MKTEDIQNKIKYKFYSYLVKYQLAKYNQNEVGKEINQNEVTTTRRSMLAIDMAARQEKIKKQEEEQIYKNSIGEDFNNKIKLKLNDILKNSHLFDAKFLNLHELLFVLLDKLHLPATTISNLEMIIKNITFIEKKICDLNNKKDIKDKLRNTLGILGLDYLKILIPYIIAENTVTRDESFPLMKNKVIEHMLLTANTNYHLVNYHKETFKELKLNNTEAYINGLFHEIGTSAVFKIYLQVFDQIWKEELKKARESLDQKKFDIISKLEPSHIDLRDVLFEYHNQYTLNIVSDFDFQRLQTGRVIEHFCSGTNFEEDSVFEKRNNVYLDILKKSNAYAEAKELLDLNLIKQEHFNYYCLSYGMKEDEINYLLKNVNKNLIKL